MPRAITSAWSDAPPAAAVPGAPPPVSTVATAGVEPEVVASACVTSAEPEVGSSSLPHAASTNAAETSAAAARRRRTGLCGWRSTTPCMTVPPPVTHACVGTLTAVIVGARHVVKGLDHGGSSTR